MQVRNSLNQRMLESGLFDSYSLFGWWVKLTYLCVNIRLVFVLLNVNVVLLAVSLNNNIYM